MAFSGHVPTVRSLYRTILVLHRFLPMELRALGDQYVKDEFRRHKTASPEEAKRFMEEWKHYKNILQAQVLESACAPHSPVKFGTNLSEKNIGDFQDEQIGQLYELMLESTKPSSSTPVKTPRGNAQRAESYNSDPNIKPLSAE